MEVFVPHLKDRNIYLDEIISFSNCNFVFGNFTEYKSSYPIVNIQFPEAIFDWIATIAEQLKEFEKKILLSKKHSKLVFTLNDMQSHYDVENNFADLFKLIRRHVDGVIHLGNYSLQKYKHLFSPSCTHAVIYHPLYESLINDFEASDFQVKFQLDLNNKFIVSVIGSVRSIEEVKLIFKIFRKIPHKNKFLVVPNMYLFRRLPAFVPYRFRKVYRKIEEKIFCFPLRKSQYFFGFKFLDYKYMVDLVQNSSLILIPRIRNLNSGNLYLGITFDKPMIIPKVGNLSEVADFFGFPILDLEKKITKEIIKSQLNLEESSFFVTNDYLEKKKQFKASVIAKQYDAFFYKLIND